MINWKSILSSFNDKPTLLEWLKMVEKALKESVLTAVLTDTKDGKTSFIFKFEDGTEIRTDYVQTKGDPGATSITGVEEVSDEVIGNQTATTLRIYLSDGTFDDVVVYAKNGNDFNLKTTTKILTAADITAGVGTFTVNAGSVTLTYNEDYSLVQLTGRLSLLVSATVNGTIGVDINLTPVVFNSTENLSRNVGFGYKQSFFESLILSFVNNSTVRITNAASFTNLTNGEVIFDFSTTFF